MIDEEFLVKIKNEIGFKPFFHDDYIPTIILESDSLVIKFQILKEHVKRFKKADIEDDLFLTVKFGRITDLMMETDGFCNEVSCLIFDLALEKKQDKYYMEIDPSCGVYLRFTADYFEIIR